MGIAFVFLLLIYVFTLPFTKIMKLEDKSRNVYSMQTLFGNVIFFAFPLFEALFGDIGVLYALFFNIGNDLLLWTLGVYLAGKHKGSGIANGLKHIFNANMIMFLVGTVLVLTKVSEKLRGGRSVSDGRYDRSGNESAFHAVCRFGARRCKIGLFQEHGEKACRRHDVGTEAADRTDPDRRDPPVCGKAGMDFRRGDDGSGDAVCHAGGNADCIDCSGIRLGLRNGGAGRIRFNAAVYRHAAADCVSD